MRERQRGRTVALGAMALVMAGAAAITPGCGARGPLDDTPWDAGADVVVDAEVDAAADAAPEAGPTGPFACGQCLARQCGSSVLACLQAPACRTTVQCVATTCLRSGSPDISCVISCASGSSEGALAAFSIFDCATRTCGGDCASVVGAVLDGVGGLGGGTPRPDAGSGPRDAGATADADAGP